jgi:hypothetical protein
MRILVTGSRHTTAGDVRLVWQTLDTCLPLALPGAPLIVVHGECPYGGVDLAADQWALNHPGLTVPERHPAARNAAGQVLGPARNSEMVNLGATLCFGFPGPNSRGTWDCLKKAVDAGISTRVYSLRGDQ